MSYFWSLIHHFSLSPSLSPSRLLTSYLIISHSLSLHHISISHDHTPLSISLSHLSLCFSHHLSLSPHHSITRSLSIISNPPISLHLCSYVSTTSLFPSEVCMFWGSVCSFLNCKTESVLHKILAQLLFRHGTLLTLSSGVLVLSFILFLHHLVWCS